jgi:plasmid stability protein
LALALAFLLMGLGRAHADYDDGLRAYESGNFLAAAEEWYLSGLRGDVASLFRLGQLYEQGLGASQNFVEAHRWYNLAASHGHSEAQEARDALATRLTAEQLAEAQDLATRTKARLQSAAAAPPAPDIGRFDSHWQAGAKLHYSSSKMKCGYQVLDLRILDGRVKGNLKIGSSHFRDAAAGDYAFTGTIDQDGTLQAEGHGVTIAGAVSKDLKTLSGTWETSAVGCRGTYEAAQEW